MIVLQAIRFTLAIILILSYFLLALPFYPLTSIFPYKSRYFINVFINKYSKILLFFLGAKVQINDLRDQPTKTQLIVCNHCSYVDILIVSSLFPTSFITSKEIKETIGLGQICSVGGCLFVERRSVKNILNEIKELSKALQNNLNVSFFPEAKSTDGLKVYSFKRSLFEAAAGGPYPVQPLTINYKKIDSQVVDKYNKDLICWYGDMPFLKHLWSICRVRSITAEIKIHPQISTENMTSAQLKDLSYEIISKSYIEIK